MSAQTIQYTHKQTIAGVIERWGFVMNIATFCMLVVFCLAYVVQINAAAAKGYKMRELETRTAELSLANQKLELAAQDAQSLESVSRAVKMLGMVPAEHMRYVAGREPSYVLAK